MTKSDQVVSECINCSHFGPNGCIEESQHEPDQKTEYVLATPILEHPSILVPPGRAAQEKLILLLNGNEFTVLCKADFVYLIEPLLGLNGIASFDFHLFSESQSRFL